MPSQSSSRWPEAFTPVWWAAALLALLVLFVLGGVAGALVGVNPYISAAVFMQGGVLRLTFEEVRRGR